MRTRNAAWRDHIAYVLLQHKLRTRRGCIGINSSIAEDVSDFGSAGCGDLQALI
jgi:hypothetical protein